MSRVIGIDLGTTNSCVSIIENNEPVVIPSSSGARTTPSVVAFSKTGERIVGETAVRQAVSNPDRTIASVKRHMGTDWSVKIDGTVYNPQKISAVILEKLKQEAGEFAGEEITDAVITVPAYFNDAQRQATRDAGRIAGLNVLRIINEPTSAALSYGLNHGDPQKIMVYDLGGGTFDVSVIEIGEGVLEVLATCGDNHLGGDDIDERITNWIVDGFKKEKGVNLRKDFAAFLRVREAAEQAKKELSTMDQTEIVLPYIASVHGEPVHLQQKLTRLQFNEMIRDLIDRTEGPVRTALADAGIRPAELGRVLLVGGSTRIPAVQHKVRAMTGKEPSHNINPDECVAMGAAVLGGTLTGNALVSKTTGQSLILFDVTPMTLSIETVGGVSTPVIKKNTTIPTKCTKTFYAMSPMQKIVEIRVLQGDRPMASDNKLIGKFRLNGLKRTPTGVPEIDVTFDIDSNGIITVSARDTVTGKMNAITINADDRMSDAEVEQARRDAENYRELDELRSRGLETYNEAQRLNSQVLQILGTKGVVADRNERKLIQKDQKALAKELARFRADRLTEEQLRELQNAKDALEHSAGSYLQ